MLCAFEEMNDQAIESEQLEIAKYYALLDKEKYFDPLHYNLHRECDELGLIDTETQHPSQQGHRHIANKIYGIWTELYGTAEYT
jgi:hypothetical protein